MDTFMLRRWARDLDATAPAPAVARREIAARMHRLALEWHHEPGQAVVSAGSKHQALRVFEVISRRSTSIQSVRDIAEELGLHPKYLMQNFKRTFGIGLWEYVMRTRIARAQHLLLTTDLSVTDAAMESGFSTLSAFYRAFKKYSNGEKPGAFRHWWRQASLAE